MSVIIRVDGKVPHRQTVAHMILLFPSGLISCDQLVRHLQQALSLTEGDLAAARHEKLV